MHCGYRIGVPAFIEKGLVLGKKPATGRGDCQISLGE